MTYTPAQTKRSNFTEHVKSLANTAKTADEFVHVASEMLDGRVAGRTKRWQDACTMAARRILALQDHGKPVTNAKALVQVELGLIAMGNAVK